MRVHVVSDVHGASEALAAAGEGADLFICLGDLLLFLDYSDPSQGMFADIFGADVAREYVSLRTAKQFSAARALSQREWEERAQDRFAGASRPEIIEQLARGQYELLFQAMPADALLTYGNVDLPHLWPDFVRPDLDVVDGQVRERGGWRFGMVGSGLPTVYRTPNEITEEEFAAKVAQLGPVDVLLTHIPPAVADLTFDTVARRFERGSVAIRDYIDEHQPQFALFGHVHQPLRPRARIGRTECLNVGHFRSRQQPFVLDLPSRSLAQGGSG